MRRGLPLAALVIDWERKTVNRFFFFLWCIRSTTSRLSNRLRTQDGQSLFFVPVYTDQGKHERFWTVISLGVYMLQKLIVRRLRHLTKKSLLVFVIRTPLCTWIYKASCIRKQLCNVLWVDFIAYSEIKRKYISLNGQNIVFWLLMVRWEQ